MFQDIKYFPVYGFWYRLNYTIEIKSDSSTIESIEVSVISFVTDQKQVGAISVKTVFDGFIGLSPCPSSMNDYSFAYQLLKDTDSHGQINNIGWQIIPRDENKMQPMFQGGYLSINEDIINHSADDQFTKSDIIDITKVNAERTLTSSTSQPSAYQPLFFQHNLGNIFNGTYILGVGAQTLISESSGYETNLNMLMFGFVIP